MVSKKKFPQKGVNQISLDEYKKTTFFISASWMAFHPLPHSSTGDLSETFLVQFHVMGVVLQSNYERHIPVRLKSSNILRQRLVHPKDKTPRVM